MPDVIELRRQRANIWEQMKGLHERAKAENRALTSEEREQWDRMDTDLKALKERVDREEFVERQDAEMAAATARPPEDEGAPAEERRLTATPEYRSAYSAYLRGGMLDLEPEQRKLLTQSRVQLSGQEARALGVGAGPTGGFTVPDEAMRPIIDAMLAFGGIRAASTTKITTESGADLPVPLCDDTANLGVRIGENAPHGEMDPAFGQKILRAYLYSSRIVRVPWQFLQDTSIGNFEAWLGTQFARRIGRITNQEMTLGAGGGNVPEGLLTASVQGAITDAVGVVAYEDLVETEHSVDPEYRTGAQWMFSDQCLRMLKELTDGMARPLWAPGIAVREPDRILGYPYVINQDFPIPVAGVWVAGTRVLAFGDMAYYWVRDVRGMTVIRLDERYADNGQVGFLAFSRHDGALMDAGTHPIRHLVAQ